MNFLFFPKRPSNITDIDHTTKKCQLFCLIRYFKSVLPEWKEAVSKLSKALVIVE